VATGLLGSAVPVTAARGAALPSATMKVFDWKTRGEPGPELATLDLSNMKASPGSHKAATRKGRGISAGQGKSCGFGDRGQKSRSGRSVRPGFEGGQIPLYRRLPKFVGRPMGPGHSKTEYGLIKLNVLNAVPEGSVVDYTSLQAQRLVSKSKYTLKKVVGSPGEFTAKGLTVKAHAFTATAREAIEGSGGTCVVLPKTAPAEAPEGEGEAAPAEAE
jgi:large subunit ribosomal protein L15